MSALVLLGVSCLAADAIIVLRGLRAAARLGRLDGGHTWKVWMHGDVIGYEFLGIPQAPALAEVLDLASVGALEGALELGHGGTMALKAAERWLEAEPPSGEGVQ